MAEYFNIGLKRVLEFHAPDGTVMKYWAEKFFTDHSEAVRYADSIRGMKAYLDVKQPTKAEDSGMPLWAVCVLKAWPPLQGPENDETAK